MTTRRVLVGAGLAGAAAGAALAVVLLLNDGGGAAGRIPGAPEVEADVALEPRIVLFGDTLRARVDVTVDRRRVDPDSVRVVQEFSPWSVLGDPARVRRDSGDASYIRTTFVLRCVISPCVPPRETAPLEFDPLRVVYKGRKSRRQVTRGLNVRWPVLVVHSRLVVSDFDRREALAAPWKADTVTLPAVSYRVSPGITHGLLLGGGALFVLLGVAFAFLGIPRRAPAPPPEPEPEPEPALPPLEQALALLEGRQRTNGAADRRRALELVAEEMAVRGDSGLERTARSMAWSEDVPAHAETSGLASLVRAALAAEKAERRRRVEEADEDGTEN